MQTHPPTGVQAAPASPHTCVCCQPHSRAHAAPRAVAGLTLKQPPGSAELPLFPEAHCVPRGSLLAGGCREVFTFPRTMPCIP